MEHLETAGYLRAMEYSHQANVDRKVGARIERERVRSGLTRIALASRIGATENDMLEIETGERRPDAGVLLDIAGVLEVPITALLTSEEI